MAMFWVIWIERSKRILGIPQKRMLSFCDTMFNFWRLYGCLIPKGLGFFFELRNSRLFYAVDAFLYN